MFKNIVNTIFLPISLVLFIFVVPYLVLSFLGLMFSLSFVSIIIFLSIYFILLIFTYLEAPSFIIYSGLDSDNIKSIFFSMNIFFVIFLIILTLFLLKITSGGLGFGYIFVIPIDISIIVLYGIYKYALNYGSKKNLSENALLVKKNNISIYFCLVMMLLTILTFAIVIKSTTSVEDYNKCEAENLIHKTFNKCSLH